MTKNEHQLADLKAARLHRLRDAVQTIIGADESELAESLEEANTAITAAVMRLWEAGQ